MAKDFAKGFYDSPAWRKTARAYKASKFGVCERCGRPYGRIVHHRVHITRENINNADVALNWDNLELLCIDCHNREHMGKYASAREGLEFNEFGYLIKSNCSAAKDF